MSALLEPAEPFDFRARWTIPSRPHLRVHAEYDEESGKAAKRRGYSVIDTRFHNLERRHLVRFFERLDEVRDWIRDGCPDAEPTP